MFSLEEILKKEVTPALGCTEPVAVALCCAHGASLLPDKDHIKEVQVWVSPGIYKNGMGVFIPGTRGEKGLFMAAALGTIAGDPSLEMEVLKDITMEDISRAKEMILKKQISIIPHWEKTGIYVKATITTARHTSQATIEGLHTKIVSLCIDEQPKILPEKKKAKTSKGENDLQGWLKQTTFKELYELTSHNSLSNLANFLKQGVEMNLSLARYGLGKSPLKGVSRALKEVEDTNNSLLRSIQIYLAAAVEARMGGAPLPAMSSAGSGNNGIVATIPLWCAYIHYKNIPEEKYIRSLAMSHLVTSKLKAHMGRITPVCSCALAAGAGAAAGFGVMSGESLEVIERTIENHLISLFGIICDGAKPSCALKLATSVSSALQAYILARKGISIPPGEGLSGENLLATLTNIETFLSQAYTKVDKSLLSVLGTFR